MAPLTFSILRHSFFAFFVFLILFLPASASGIAGEFPDSALSESTAAPEPSSFSDIGAAAASAASAASAEDDPVRIRILMVCYNDFDVVSKTIGTMMFGSSFECDRIPAFDAFQGPSPALLEKAESGFEGYDIVVFDMGGHEAVSSSLAAAKEAGVKIACLDGSDVAYSSNPAVDTSTNESAFNFAEKCLAEISKASGDEPRLLSERFLMSLADAFVPEKTARIPGWADQQSPVRVLYIGPDAPRPSAPESIGMKEAVDAFQQEIYRGASAWTYLPLDTSSSPESTYSVDLAAIKSLVTENASYFSGYDVIVCDSFSCLDGADTFQDLFGIDSLTSENIAAAIGPETALYAIRPVPSKLPACVKVIFFTGSGVNADNIEDAYDLFREIILNEGTDMMRSWPAIDYVPGEIYYLPLNRCFSDVDAYLEWYVSSGRYTPGAPYIGIFGFDTYKEPMSELTEIIESRGFNVILGMSNSYEFYTDMCDAFKDENGNSRVACFISYKNWALQYLNQPEGVDMLESLNVPVIKIVGKDSLAASETMYDINSGIPEHAFSWMASSSNVDGMIDFISGWSGTSEAVNSWAADRAIAWVSLNVTANADKDIAFLYYNYPPGKSDIGANYLNVMRSLAGDGAKRHAADASAEIRDPVFKGILREFQEQGYTADFSGLPLVTIKEGGEHVFDYSEKNLSLIMNEENLLNLIYTQGINVGSYAPGVLDTMVEEYIDFTEDPGKNNDDWWGCELIPVSDYIAWMTDAVDNGLMNESLKKDVESEWGPLSGDDSIANAVPGPSNRYLGGMIWNDKDGRIGPAGTNYIVVPMIKIGDIRLMPQPNRALADAVSVDSATYHGDIAPTHQYVAVYFWLDRGTGHTTTAGTAPGALTGVYDVRTQAAGDAGADGASWKADAIVHFGTHGTQEWMPGTSVGLSRTDDWGPVLLPRLPVIYPYIVANVGEGLVAEYRGNALIISHMTPPMVKTQLYDDIIEMESAIQGYQKNKATGTADAQLMRSYREIIVGAVYSMGWQDAFIDTFYTYRREISPADPANVSDELVQKYLIENATVSGMADTGVFDVFLNNHLHSYVEAIKENSLSYGMHTYGYFEENQIASMVWNMWSRQGLDDVLLDTYFDDVKAAGGRSIPTSNEYSFIDGEIIKGGDPTSKYDERHVLEFVRLLTGIEDHTPSAGDIRDALDMAFTDPEDVGSREKQDKIVLFLLGPSAAFSEEESSASVFASWKKYGIYDDFRAQLFDFYWYQSVPKHLRDETSNDSALFRASDGTTLNDEKLDSVMTSFIDAVLADGSFRTEPSGAIESALASSGLGNGNTSRPWYNGDMVAYVLGNEMILYPAKLRACGDSETASLFKALEAGFISPSSGNDPVQNPAVLPTGRNFYGVDASTYSTPAAWKAGKAMAQQTLVNYYETYGTWPDTFSFMRFGVDFIRDEGSLEACVFYMLGCEPTWRRTGVFTGGVPVTLQNSDQQTYDDMFRLTLTNGTVVYRPRVDIVYNSAGMRDGYGSMLRFIDKAVKAVAALEEDADVPAVSNQVRENAASIKQQLIDAGIDEETAEELSTSRIFAQALGTYEIGTGNLVSASGNMGNAGQNQEDLKAIADKYLENMGYLYTQKNWGTSSDAVSQTLRTLLGRTDASLFASSSNLYDSLDNDDLFQYFGVMNMASSMYDDSGLYIENKSEWDVPQMYIADTSNIDHFREGDKIVYTAGEYIQKDLTARYMDPKWIQGMMESGYSGSTMMAEFIDNLYGWSVATNGEVISDATWNKVFEMYSNNSTVRDWMSQTSPYALQSITSRLIETARTGNWNASDTQMSALLSRYVESVVESGVACCHHTCGNPTFDAFVTGLMSNPLAENIDRETWEQYWELVSKATDREKPDIPLPASSEQSSTGGVGSASLVPGTAPQSGPAQIDAASDPDQGDSAQDPGDRDGDGGDGFGRDTTQVSGYQMIEKTVSNAISSLSEFLRNPTFSASSMAAILFVILLVGVIFYGFRKKGL